MYLCSGRDLSLLFLFEVKMTVSTTTNKVDYIGNGVATSFAIPFPFLEQEHLKVYQLLNDVQTERTDWTVSGGNMILSNQLLQSVHKQKKKQRLLKKKE